MLKIMVVDDEAISRTAIATMIDWEEFDCKIVCEAAEGAAALKYLQSNEVHLVITDMKMPIMDGLELIREIKGQGYQCRIVVISSYNEFDMVREAFKLGVNDYYLKSELKPEYFYSFISNLKQENIIFHYKNNVSIGDTFREDVLGANQIDSEKYANYYIMIWQVDDMDEVRTRFPNIRQDLFSSIFQITKQIPKIEKYCKMTNYSETKILVYCQLQENEDEIYSLCNRIILVVKDYLNVNINIGISSYGANSEQLFQCVQEAEQNLALRYILTSQKIYTMQLAEQYSLQEALTRVEEYNAIIQALKEFSDMKLSKAQFEVLHDKSYEDVDTLKLKVLHMILIESMYFEEIGESIWNAFVDKQDYVVKLNRLVTSGDIVIWCTNFNRWILNYLQQRYQEHITNNPMEKVRIYIEDNYSNHNLTLGEVAELVELNEQYFCSKFRKEFGKSFVEYLTHVRMEKSKDLIMNTNLKIYEISDSVGYKNVEHFTRIFRKKIGKTPREYKEKSST